MNRHFSMSRSRFARIDGNGKNPEKKIPSNTRAMRGYVPGVVGGAWICDEHLPIALECVDLPVKTAICQLRQQVGVQRYCISNGLDEPHLRGEVADRVIPEGNVDW